MTAVLTTGGGLARLASNADTTPTALPELIAASLGGSALNANFTPTDPADDYAQTSAAFTFSRPVASIPAASRFHLVGFDSNLRYDGQSAAVQGDGSTVLVAFGTAARPINKHQARDIALATVSTGAVVDEANHAGPMGSTAIGDVQNISDKAGTTIGPNLVSVGNFRAQNYEAELAAAEQANPLGTPPTPKPFDTYVDFTFDKAAWPASGPLPGSPRLVMTDGTVITCTWLLGIGTNVLTADCPNSSSSPNTSPTTIAPSSVVRGLLDAGAVSDSGQDAGIAQPQGSLNALQTVSTSGATSPAPELTGATLLPNTSDGTTTVDQVLYTFNQAVTPGTSTAGQPNCAISGGATPQVTGACFFVYDTEGVMTSAANANNSGSAVESSPPAKSNDDPRTLVVTFPAGTLTHAVGAGIYENGAMLANTPGTGAHASSVPVGNTATTTRTPGMTAGPRLTGVGVLSNVSPPAGVYSFDQDVTMITPASLSTQRLYLVDADATVLQCANATVASGFSPGQNNIVTCTNYIVVDGSVTPNAASGAQISNAVLGGIDRGALQNLRSQQNPEGSAHTGLPPTVTAVSPAAGPEAGGTKVAITGTNFFDVAGVSFGAGKPATAFKVVSPTLITAKSPAHDAGQVHLLVTTQGGGASTFSASDLFTYLPKPPHPSTKNACPDSKVPSARFKDIRGDSHRAAIDCLAWWGVAKAYKDNTFRPKRSLHRDQLATLIADTIRRSGGTLPKNPKNAFTDDRKNKHQADINAVAAAGIMTGYGRVFNPTGVVSRADFAAIAARAYKHRTETRLPSDFEYFADVAPSMPGAEEINAVAQAGIIGGYNDGTFRPGLRVHRGTAATFLVRLLDVIVRNGYAHPPATS